MNQAAVTNPCDWQVAGEEMGHVSVPRRPTELRQVQARENSQWSEVVEIGHLNPGLEAAMRTVLEFSTLRPGWDGYRSPTVGKPAISGALNLLAMLEGLVLPNPHVAPIPGGGIQIEWARSGKELEIDFRHDGTMGYLAVDPNEEDSEGQLTLQDHKLWSLLVWLSE